MKKLLIALAAAATVSVPLVWGLTVNGASTPAEGAPEKVAGLTKSTPAATATDEVKTLPMNSRADVIDTKARFFVTKRKDGVEVKNVLTDTTEIKQGSAAAKLEDINVGDYVSGSRRKVSTTEYTVIKITKFGPRVSKKNSAAAKAN
jgi:hypothetical protein